MGRIRLANNLMSAPGYLILEWIVMHKSSAPYGHPCACSANRGLQHRLLRKSERKAISVAHAISDAVVRRFISTAGTLVGGFSWGLLLAPWQQFLDGPTFLAYERSSELSEEQAPSGGRWRVANAHAPLLVYWSS